MDVATKLPSAMQMKLLNTLVAKNKNLLNSTADDEPLKLQVWTNIIEEVNSVANGSQLTVNEWKKLVDWSKYLGKKRGRPTKRKIDHAQVDDSYTIKHQLLEKDDEDDVQSEESNITSPDGINLGNIVGFENVERNGNGQQTEYMESFINFVDEKDNNEVDESNDDDDEITDHFGLTETIAPIKPSPLVKSFKYTSRIAKAVDDIKCDMNEIKRSLQENTIAITTLSEIAQQQLQGQHETNLLLRRNNKLLKIIAEYHIGERP